MLYDLHIHTTCSDGKYRRIELLRRMNDLGFKYACFSDHNYLIDDINSLNTEYKKEYNENQKVEMFLATELDIEEYSRLHILGYDFKNISPVIKMLEKYLKENTEICRDLVNKIYNQYGIEIPFNELINYTENGDVTKNIIVQWLIDNNYANSVYDAGMRFTSKYSPCYVERSRLKLLEAFDLIKNNGGKIIMAHPSSVKMNNEELEKFIVQLKEKGLDGIEVYNADKTNQEQLLFYRQLAKKYQLFETSGSDFHRESTTPIFGVNNDYSNGFIKGLKRNV